MVVVEGTKTRRHTIGLIPKRRIFSCMISEGTVIQKSWHHSYVKAIAPHFFVLSKTGEKRKVAEVSTGQRLKGADVFGADIRAHALILRSQTAFKP
jgi:hypothetical protein